MSDDQPKVRDLQNARKKKADEKAGSGGISKLKDDIQAIASFNDVKQVLKKLVKVMVDQ